MGQPNHCPNCHTEGAFMFAKAYKIFNPRMEYDVYAEVYICPNDSCGLRDWSVDK